MRHMNPLTYNSMHACMPQPIIHNHTMPSFSYLKLTGRRTKSYIFID